MPTTKQSSSGSEGEAPPPQENLLLQTAFKVVVSTLEVVAERSTASAPIRHGDQQPDPQGGAKLLIRDLTTQLRKMMSPLA